MLANNLRRPVAFDTLSAGIPIGDDAVCIQQVNGVVRYTPDKKPEASFALTKLRQGLAQLSGALFYILLKRFVELAPRVVDLFGGGKIDQHVHRADQPTRSIVEWRRVGHKWYACSVRPLGYRLPAPDRPVFFQRLGHRALVMRHRPAIRPIQAPRNAPSVAAYFGRATRELHCGLIKKGDPTGSVGRVDRRRQRIEQLARVAQLVFKLDPLLHIPPVFVLSDATA